MMLIALDYDKTYTLDPEFWDMFIYRANKAKHQVVIVTMRNAITETITSPPCLVIYTNRQAKNKHCQADVWIDDQPGYIYQDAL